MKKLFALLLILALTAVLFVGCDNGSSSSDDTTTTTTTTEETTTIESDPLVDGMSEGEDTDTGWGEVNPLK